MDEYGRLRANAAGNASFGSASQKEQLSKLLVRASHEHLRSTRICNCARRAVVRNSNYFPEPLVVFCLPRPFAVFSAGLAEGASVWTAATATLRRPNPMFFARFERAAA